MKVKRDPGELIASAAISPDAARRAPSTLKSRIYSRLVQEQSSSGSLRSLSETAGLCVFEELVQIAPVGEAAKSINYCRVCHARVAGERWENAWIFWANCPYVKFQNR